MGQTLAQKIIAAHLVDGTPAAGSEVGLRIDQTLTQDATGTMAYLEYEAMGIPRVKTELSVAYIDHNTLQSGFMNADDHRFIRTIAKRIGVRYSRPGNGICHQVHLERFAKPGKTLIGSDSHTPTAGGIGCLAMGAGGLDVAVAMGGGAYYIPYPKFTLVKLTGKLRPMVSAKDVILEVLRRMTVKGGVGKIIEYGGDGVACLSVPQRATITNMGAELGATTSIFPSDDVTCAFLAAQGRGEDYVPLSADEDAVYDEVLEIDLSALEPLVACPHSPDNVKPAKSLALQKVDQVCIGSCTNSSYTDLMTVAAMLKGKTVCPEVSLTISPGSRQVLAALLFAVPFLLRAVYAAKTNFHYPYPLLALAGLYCFYASSFTPTLFVYGTNDEKRVKDIQFCLWVLVCLAALWYVLGWAWHRFGAAHGRRLHRFALPYLAAVALFGALAFVPQVQAYQWSGTACVSAVYYLRSGVAQAYDEAMYERLDMLATEEEDIVFPMLPPEPWICFHEDLARETYNWKNEAFAEYYGKHTVAVAAPE